MNFEGVIIQSLTLSKVNGQFLIRKEGVKKAMGEKSLQPKILYPAKLAFKSERQIMSNEINSSQKDKYYMILLTYGVWNSYIHRSRKYNGGNQRKGSRGIRSSCSTVTETSVWEDKKKFCRWRVLIAQQCEHT